eukprot:c18288_g1_i2.p1 GENE.c18288_g1_i2~~c18288_g1_i2.p1  ORF type:complete len:662 (+),score=137.80 c18288_g1_i2:100-1986(+)
MVLSREVAVALLESGQEALILSALSNPETFDQSFLTPDTNAPQFDAAAEFFSILESTKHPNVPSLHAVSSAIAHTLPKPYPSHPSAVGWAPPNSPPPSLHHLHLLLACPLLLEPEFHETVCLALFAALARQHPDQRHAFINSLTHLTTDEMAQRATTIHHWLAIELNNEPHPLPIALACQAMQLLFEANQISEAVSVTLFHDECINQSIDVNAHFRTFRNNLGLEAPQREFTYCDFPFLLDTDVKSRLMQHESEIQMSQQFEQAFFRLLFAGGVGSYPFMTLNVRRNRLIHDTITQLHSMADNELKKPLQVSFVGEEAVDAGGVRKEFFQIVMEELFDLKYGMFTLNEQTNTFWFNRNSFDAEEFELVGSLLGIAIYNSIILDLHFPMPVYKILLGHPLRLNDLLPVDPALHSTLVNVLQASEEECASLGLSFEVSFEHFGESVTEPLKPDGGDIAVDITNRQEFVDLYVQYALEKSIETQVRAFKKGFIKVCGGYCLKMFAAEELELLICGSKELDFRALEASCQYDGGFTAESVSVKQFWEVVHGFNRDQKKALLFFCTGSDRAPIKGLGNLAQGFTISRNGPDSDRLPTCHTCFNHLLLPEYSSKEKLERFLLTAIQNSKGFGLK